MYARQTLLRLGPNRRTLAEQIADNAFPIYRAQNGFKSIVFLADDAKGEYGSLSVWESKEAAEGAIGALGAWLQQNYGNQVQGAPETQLLEVYEPRS